MNREAYVMPEEDSSAEDMFDFGRRIARLMNYPAYAAVCHLVDEEPLEAWITQDKLPPPGSDPEEYVQGALEKLDEIFEELEELTAGVKPTFPQVSQLQGGVHLEDWAVAVGGLCEERNRFVGGLMAWRKVHGLEVDERLEHVVLPCDRSACVIRVSLEDRDAFTDFMVECGIPPLPFMGEGGHEKDGFFIRTNDPAFPLVGVAFCT